MSTTRAEQGEGKSRGMSTARATLLALVLLSLGSCRVGPTLPPGCICGPPIVIDRGATYAADLPSPSGAASTRATVIVSPSGATSLSFTRGPDTITQAFSSTSIP